MPRTNFQHEPAFLDQYAINSASTSALCQPPALGFCVEEYHKALKSGTGVEDNQLERAHRIGSLVAVLGIVAVRLLNTKSLARTRPDEQVDAKVLGPQLLALLAAQFGRSTGGWTHRIALVAVARAGGFLARLEPVDVDVSWIRNPQTQTKTMGVMTSAEAGC